MSMGHYLRCRRRAFLVRWQAGILGVSYYLLLFFVYNKSYGMENMWLVATMYALTHGSVLLISFLSNRLGVVGLQLMNLK